MSYAQVTGMSSTRYPLKGLGGCGCAGLAGCGCAGLGQAAMTPETRWKYTALGLGALVIGQFFWWDSKAPQVLRGGGRFKRNRRHRR